MTPLGPWTITIAKTFLLPQFLYLMQTRVLGDETLKKINNIIFKYIWSKREQDSQNTDVKVIEKVKRECIIQNYADHGLNMIDTCRRPWPFPGFENYRIKEIDLGDIFQNIITLYLVPNYQPLIVTQPGRT